MRGRLAVFLLMMIPFAAQAGGGAPDVITIAAGAFLTGSSRAEKELAYALDEVAYGHSVTRQNKWYENELPVSRRQLGNLAIMRHLVTNADYQAFVDDTGYPAPGVSRAEWNGYGLIHPYPRAEKYIWQGRLAPPGRGRHPVVMVSHDDARAYADWLSAQTGTLWRLPNEPEWEKAARGTDGRYFPWGNQFEAGRLNSHDTGPFETMPVGSFPAGASAFGLMDGAGQVFEWTATRAGAGRYIVKGGSWDDKGCGICRPAARHGRPEHIKHILIGFRLVKEGER